MYVIDSSTWVCLRDLRHYSFVHEDFAVVDVGVVVIAVAIGLISQLEKDCIIMNAAVMKPDKTVKIQTTLTNF